MLAPPNSSDVVLKCVFMCFVSFLTAASSWLLGSFGLPFFCQSSDVMSHQPFFPLQVVHQSIPENSSQSIHAFSTTTLNDIMKSFSDVSVIRVAGGYLLMVGATTAALSTYFNSKKIVCFIYPPGVFCNLPLSAGLRLRDHAKVGLCQVPGGGGAGGGAAGGSVGGRRSGLVLAARPLLQRCHHTGTTPSKPPATVTFSSFQGCCFKRTASLLSPHQVLPFLALGIGVDDMFLLAHSFTEAGTNIPFTVPLRCVSTPKLPPSILLSSPLNAPNLCFLQERTGDCLRRTGTSVALTSVNNMIAFFMAALVPIPALRAFSLQVGSTCTSTDIKTRQTVATHQQARGAFCRMKETT